LGIGNAAGMFQRNLQRAILYKFTKNDENKIEKFAHYLFPGFLNRASRYGRRSKRSIIYDNFILPKDNHPTTYEVLSMFEKNNVAFYSAWPPILPNNMQDSAQETTKDYLKYKYLLSYGDKFAAIHNTSDNFYYDNKKNQKNQEAFNSAISYISDVEPNSKIDFLKLKKLINKKNIAKFITLDKENDKKFERWQKEVSSICEIMKKNDIKKLKNKIQSLKIVFNKNAGLGMNYYMGYKR